MGLLDVIKNLFGVTALSLKHRQNSNSLFRLGETDTIWHFVHTLDDGAKDTLSMFMMISDWGGVVNAVQTVSQKNLDRLEK